MFVLWDLSNHEAIVDLSCPFGRCRNSCGCSRNILALPEPGSERELEKMVVGALNACLPRNGLVNEVAWSGGTNDCCGTLFRSLLPFIEGGRRGVLGSLPS